MMLQSRVRCSESVPASCGRRALVSSVKFSAMQGVSLIMCLTLKRELKLLKVFLTTVED